MGHVFKSVLHQYFADEFGRPFLRAHDADLFPFGHTGHAILLHLDKLHVGDIDHVERVRPLDFEASELDVVTHVQQQKIFFVGQPGKKIIRGKGLDFHYHTSRGLQGFWITPESGGDCLKAYTRAAL